MDGSFHIGWPEGIYLAINLFGLLFADDIIQTRKSTAFVIWVLITLPLLWWGGFFS